VDAGLPVRTAALVVREEEQHPDDRRLAEGQRERLLVVRGLGRLADGFRGRRLGPGVESCLARRDLRLDAILAVEDGQRRSRLCRPVEGLAEEGDELVVVRDPDRRRERVADGRRDARVVAVDVDRERVHDRRGPAARAVRGPEALDERGRRVGRARPVRAIRATRGDRAAIDLHLGGDGLDRVVRLREQREVGRRCCARPVRRELGEPEAIEVGLVAHDHVPEGGNVARDRSGIRGEVGPLLVGERRRPRAGAHDGDVDADAVADAGVDDVAELVQLVVGRLRRTGSPQARDAYRAIAREAEGHHLRLGLDGRGRAHVVLDSADDEAWSGRGEGGRDEGDERDEGSESGQE
jgi:hypothetical protein